MFIPSVISHIYLQSFNMLMLFQKLPLWWVSRVRNVSVRICNLWSVCMAPMLHGRKNTNSLLWEKHFFSCKNISLFLPSNMAAMQTLHCCIWCFIHIFSYSSYLCIPGCTKPRLHLIPTHRQERQLPEWRQDILQLRTRIYPWRHSILRMHRQSVDQHQVQL